MTTGNLDIKGPRRLIDGKVIDPDGQWSSWISETHTIKPHEVWGFWMYDFTPFRIRGAPPGVDAQVVIDWLNENIPDHSIIERYPVGAVCTYEIIMVHEDDLVKFKLTFSELFS